MPRFAANLSLMYNEHPFMERFAAAAADGFQAVEFLFPYEYDIAAIKQQLDAHGLTLALFNFPPGNWAAGERGLAALPGREEEFKRSVEQALAAARLLGNKRLHLMAGILPKDADRAQYRDAYIGNLAYAADQAASLGITILVEPINTRDMPGYFLNYQADAKAVCDAVGRPNLQLQFDMYHCQIMEGDVATKLRQYLPCIGHVQIAGVPERHEPDIGELHYPYLFRLMDELGYAAWIGCEYRPKAGTSEGLGWLQPWLPKR